MAAEFTSREGPRARGYRRIALRRFRQAPVLVRLDFVLGPPDAPTRVGLPPLPTDLAEAVPGVSDRLGPEFQQHAHGLHAQIVLIRVPHPALPKAASTEHEHALDDLPLEKGHQRR